jgi:radical SAM-linked protein
MDAYLRQRNLKEILPWDHIDCMVDKQYFVDEYWRSRMGLLAEDCRQVKCHQCGVIDDDKQGCLTMLRTSREGAKKEQRWQRQSRPERPHTLPQQKIRYRFAIQGPLRFLSHLETIRVFTRALRRARIPVQHSQGFHPHPQLAFATARPVGLESTGEYADLVLYETLDPAQFLDRLNAVLPAHIRLLAARTVALKAPALMAEPLAARYTVEFPPPWVTDDGRSLAERVQALMACRDIPVPRWHKKGTRQVNIRPGIDSLEVLPAAGDMLTLSMLLREEELLKAKPQEVIQALLGVPEDDLYVLRILKHEVFIRQAAQLTPLLDYQPCPAPAREVCV